MINGEHSRLTFRVKCETEFGQVVAISGDTSGLGFFRKSSTVQLVTTPEDYPYWKTSTPIVVPSHHIIKYKLCILEGGTFHSYEAMDGNRSIIPQQLDIFIEADYTIKKSSDISNVPSDTDLLVNDNVPKAREYSNPASFDSNDAFTGQGHRLLFTCYHLPVIVKRIETPDLFEITWSESVLAKTENSVSSAVETFWIGTLTLDDSVSSDDKIILVRILKSMNCIPIFIEKSVANGHYHGYCKQVLWPLFHNVDQIDSLHAVWKSTIVKNKGIGNRTRTGSDAGGSAAAGGGTSPGEELAWILEFYDKYLQVNKFFADVITGMLEPGDIVWVHDYHLILLPKLLRDSHDYKRCCALSTNPNLGMTVDTNTQMNNNNTNTNTMIPDRVRIIFFLHIPFPTSQIFRTLPRGTELLHSLMCADVIGFHSFDYTRHFLNAAKRILGNKSRARPGGLLSLVVDDREIIVTMNHLAIEPLLLQQALLNPTTRIIAESYASKYAGKKIVVGVDPCQRLSGLTYKFEAFERFLNENTSRGASKNVVLIQKCIRNGSRREDEVCTSAELNHLVNNINTRFNKKNSLGGLNMPSANARANSAAIMLSSGSSPIPNSIAQNTMKNVIEYEEVSALNLVQRVALWLVSDVFLLTSLREGLNSSPMEYIYTRKSLPHAGAVIASEFSLTSSLLSGSIKINPFNVQLVVDSLEKCIYMTDQEANHRRMRDLDFISSRHSSTWVRRIFQDMAQLNRNTSVEICYLLDPADVVESYKKSIMIANTDNNTNNTNSTGNVVVGTRVFIIDYGGTLAAKQKVDIYVKEAFSVLSESVPSDSVLDSLRTLSEDPNNIVMICSGISMEKLSGVFTNLPNVTLVASHGMSYSWGMNISDIMAPMDKDNEISSSFISKAVNIHDREWFVRQFNVDWAVIADIAVPVITKFKERTNGTTADLKPPMLRFNYFGADPDWGMKQASQLVIELEASLAKHDVKVISSSDGSVEILPFGVDKSTLPKLLLNRLLLIRKICIGNTSQLPRFIVCMGDDKSNDQMFSSVYDTVARIVIPPQKIDAPSVIRSHIYTIGVGKMSCDAAEYYVRGIEDVESLLENLSSVTGKNDSDVDAIRQYSVDSTHSHDLDDIEPY